MKHIEDVEREIWSQAILKRALAKRPLVPVYRVGEPLRRGRRQWPVGGQLTYSQGGLELTIFHSNISDAIVTEVRRGEVELALVVELPLIVFAYRFGDAIPWDDAPYSWHLQPADWRVIPSVDPSPEARALLWITLVGADDGMIHAQRGVTLAPDFTRALHRAIRAQALMPFDSDDCAAAIAKIFLDQPGIVGRLASAQARTLGNQ